MVYTTLTKLSEPLALLKSVEQMFQRNMCIGREVTIISTKNNEDFA